VVFRLAHALLYSSSAAFCGLVGSSCLPNS
jgi:hypothetical protein